MATIQRHNTKCSARKGLASHARKGWQVGTHGAMCLAV